MQRNHGDDGHRPRCPSHPPHGRPTHTGGRLRGARPGGGTRILPGEHLVPSGSGFAVEFARFAENDWDAIMFGTRFTGLAVSNLYADVDQAGPRSQAQLEETGSNEPSRCTRRPAPHVAMTGQAGLAEAQQRAVSNRPISTHTRDQPRSGGCASLSSGSPARRGASGALPPALAVSRRAARLACMETGFDTRDTAAPVRARVGPDCAPAVAATDFTCEALAQARRSATASTPTTTSRKPAAAARPIVIGLIGAL